MLEGVGYEKGKTGTGKKIVHNFHASLRPDNIGA